jgi:hypothetical protein
MNLTINAQTVFVAWSHLHQSIASCQLSNQMEIYCPNKRFLVPSPATRHSLMAKPLLILHDCPLQIHYISSKRSSYKPQELSHCFCACRSGAGILRDGPEGQLGVEGAVQDAQHPPIVQHALWVLGRHGVHRLHLVAHTGTRAVDIPAPQQGW